MSFPLQGLILSSIQCIYYLNDINTLNGNVADCGKSATYKNITSIGKSQKSPGMSPKKLFTLVFLKRSDSVLLGLKTRGLGKGLWNGFGGKIEENETVTNAAKRELLEECNLIAKDLRHIGVVRYDTEFDDSASIVHIFVSSEFEGEERASEEMNPLKWYKFHEIPFQEMWPDAVKWYPLMLEEKFFSAHVIYSTKSIISKSIIEEYGSLSNALKLAQF